MDARTQNPTHLFQEGIKPPITSTLLERLTDFIIFNP